MAAISLEAVSKTYSGGVAAVRRFDMMIADGEFVALLGPSGCGKSTALRLVAGLESLSEGTIRIADKVVNDLPPRDRDVAMVFQNYALYPQMTVAENMEFALKLRRVSRAEIDRRVSHAASMLELSSLLHRTPRTLSGGQRQRVALGRAMVREPQCFLFDEPLSNLDAKLRTETRAEIKRLHRSLGVTTLYVTHDQEEAMTLADRIVVMRSGQVQQIGTPLEVYRNPANRFVAGFVGVPHMNFVTGEVVASAGALRFDTGAGWCPISQAVGVRLAGAEGCAAVLGIRPQALALTHVRPPEGAAGLVARVTLIEIQGDHMHVHVAAGPHTLVVQCPTSEAFAADTDVFVTIDPERAIYFDRDSGERL